MKLIKSINQLIQERPLGFYFLLAFALPWVPSFLVAGPKFFRGEDIELLSILIGAAMFAAPILSAVLMALIVDGKRGIREMFRHMKVWRLGRWYLSLLIFPVLILTISLLLAAVVSPDFTPVFLISGIMMGIAAGFFEEVGWMGFAFPRMREKFGLIRASVVLGFLHGLWHFPLWFLFQYSNLGILWFPYFIAFVLVLVALRLIMALTYSQTRSLLLSQLIHASSTGFLFVLTPMYSEPVNEVIFYSVYAISLWTVALIAIRRMAGSSK